MVVQGEMAEFPNFPIGRVTVKFITIKSARGHSYKACELALAAARVKAIPAGEDHDAQLWAEGCGPGDQVGRRPRRAGRDPRVADALAVTTRRNSFRREEMETDPIFPE